MPTSERELFSLGQRPKSPRKEEKKESPPLVGRPFCGIARINHRGRVEKEEEKGGTKEQGSIRDCKVGKYIRKYRGSRSVCTDKHLGILWENKAGNIQQKY